MINVEKDTKKCYHRWNEAKKPKTTKREKDDEKRQYNFYSNHSFPFSFYFWSSRKIRLSVPQSISATVWTSDVRATVLKSVRATVRSCHCLSVSQYFRATVRPCHIRCISFNNPSVPQFIRATVRPCHSLSVP